ncbi:MAG: DUF4157 domain-containing protein [Candidatus Brocadia sp.]|nr:DUF4157 domain-containing protein [Candidatus Brocadia sp.]
MSESIRTAAKKPEASKHVNSVSKARKVAVSSSVNSPVDQIFFLQRTIGNQAVQRLLKGVGGHIQAKLKIGPPNDIYEQEADRVAEQVMRMPEKQHIAYSPLRSLAYGHSCSAIGNKPYAISYTPYATSIQTKPGWPFSKGPACGEEETLLQTKGVSGNTPEVTPSAESQINSIRSGGHSLPESVRAFFEPRFGQDFSQVRIHTDSNAGESAKAVNALVYTVGRDVVFSGGQYSPETESGKKLIAHELTHVVQQKDNHSHPIIRRKNVPAGKGEFGVISTHEYQNSATFKDKGEISIESRTNIIKTSEVVHDRQTPKGREKLPYEFILEHERRVEIQTVSGDRAVLIIKANKYLPFDKLSANPDISPKKAISLSGDFCNVRWSLDGKYGTEKFKEELFRRHGIIGSQTVVGGKTLEIFFAADFYEKEILKPKNPRDPCSLKVITEKTGPAFLRFNLSDQEQYEHIVGYLAGLLDERLRSEVDIRKKLEEEKKRRGEKEEDIPTPQLTTAIEKEAESAPEDLKTITLPGWLKGILIALGIALAAVAAVAAVCAIIAGAAELAVGAAFATVFWAAFKIIGTAILVAGFVRSLINRFGESKLSGIGDFFKKLGISILDILSIGEFIESFTDRSLITGKPLNLSEEDRWKRRTFGVLSIIGALFGIRSWLKKGPPKGPVRGGGAAAVEAMVQRQIEIIFGELGGQKTGYKIRLCDDATVIETPTGGVYYPGKETRLVGGAVTDPTRKTIWVHESVVTQNGVVRKWGSALNLKQVIAHELGHAQTGSFSCSVASRTGANLPGLTAAERKGLLDDAANIETK